MTPDWHRLVQEYISGVISQSDAEALEQQMMADPRLMDWYLDALNLDTALAASVEAAEMRRLLSFDSDSAVNPGRGDGRATRLSRPVRAVLCALAGACALLLWVGMPRDVTAEIQRVSDDFSGPWKANTAVRVDRMTWGRGSCELRLPSGVFITIEGPADLRILNPMEIRLVTGKITADVGAGGKGFCIETPEARIVDLGTVFGVDSTSAARTDVVVFHGKVEVHEKGGLHSVARLSRGEGVRVERNRRTSRIVSVNGSEESGGWSAVDRHSHKALITSVGDSMSADEEEAERWPSLRNFYRIVPGGLREGVRAFSDTQDEWTSIPEELVGADQVRTFAVDRYNWWMQLSLEISRPCELFIFVDQRNPVPSWVGETFSDTGKTILLNFKPDQGRDRVLAQYPFSVWSRRVDKPGILALGPPYENPPEDRRSFKPNSMFGIAAREAP